jgi:hypothetical protein
MKLKNTLRALLCLSGLIAGSVCAAPIIASTVSLAGTNTVTFSEVPLAPNQAVTTQFAAYGVTFAPGTFYYDPQPGFFATQAVGNYNTNNGAQTSPSQSSIFFTSTVSAADFNVLTNPGSTLFEAFLNGSLVESFSAITNTTDQTLFYGFRNVNFNEIRFGAPANNAVQIDNVQTTAVPEPTTIAVFGLGLLGLIAARRRKV